MTRGTLEAHLLCYPDVVVINEQIASVAGNNGDVTIRALHIIVPGPPVPSTWTRAGGSGSRVHPHDRLGGLRHEYTLAS